MKKWIYLFPIVCLFFTGGCTEITETPSFLSTAPLSSQVDFTATASQTVTPTPSNTTTYIPPSPTSTQTPTQTVVPGVVRHCLEVQPSLPETHQYSGRWILVTYPGLSYSLYDLNTKEIIPTDGDLPVSVSPDRTMYASVIFSSKQLKVYTADGKLINTFVGQNWSHVNKWIDNHRVLIVTFVQESELFMKYPQDYVLLNLTTSETQVLISDYPDIDRASHNFRWGYSGTTVYDPTLTRVVYLNGFALYDIPGKTILAQLTNVYLGDEPKWSPDGSRIIVSAGAEFYLISRDGQITQASHMNPNYNPETRKGYDYMSSYYSWSPNGNKIALWLQVYDSKTINPTITLAVLDIASGIITDTCIPAGFNPEKLFKFPEPVWSPDGNSLVIDTNFNEEEKTTGVVLVDLEKQAAYKVLENYYPLGWLVAP